ncbi:hypothetical protein [Brachybacterium sp. Z12]|uniref:Gfo/Idh/MocA family protein n=1 Tax=Brachybacterium sp. Z12 TaxID=2759167 RepID=UPI0037BEDAA4
MWARFLPQYDVLQQVISSGLLGEIIEVTADHGQTFPADPSHRMYAPELGGGALLDLGVYPLSFAQMVLGDLSDLAVRGDLAETGGSTRTSRSSPAGPAAAVPGYPRPCSPEPPRRPRSAAPPAPHACPARSSRPAP